jgi:hypothetical protein
MGLGKESLAATDTATAASTKATSSTKDSSAIGRATTPAYFTFIFCTITLFTLLV